MVSANSSNRKTLDSSNNLIENLLSRFAFLFRKDSTTEEKAYSGSYESEDLERQQVEKMARDLIEKAKNDALMGR